MKNCYCCSNQPFESCCEPYILKQKRPSKAVELMRSRYSAFATANSDYLNFTSVHQQNSQDLAAYARNNKWLSLEIIDTEKGKETDNEGTVSFIAKYESNNQLIEHYEKSIFIKKENQWRYLSGKVNTKNLKINNISLGRNDLCSCGSGKKYKKCCC